jgi:hypothetical protein
MKVCVILSLLTLLVAASEQFHALDSGEGSDDGLVHIKPTHSQHMYKFILDNFIHLNRYGT